jgi:hypothetical protein
MDMSVYEAGKKCCTLGINDGGSSWHVATNGEDGWAIDNHGFGDQNFLTIEDAGVGDCGWHFLGTALDAEWLSLEDWLEAGKSDNRNDDLFEEMVWEYLGFL